MKRLSFLVFFAFAFSRTGAQGATSPIESTQNKSSYKVTEGGVYEYEVDIKSRKNETSALRFGLISAPKIAIDPKVGTTFSRMYGEGPFPILLYDWEFYKFESIPELWINAGFGFFSSTGQGRFAKDGSGNERIAKESYGFYGLPLSLGLSYNFAFTERPFLMPQIGFGGSYFIFSEVREDNQINYAGSLGFYGQVSLLFNVTKYDRETSFIMDREYNIRNLWLSFEYRSITTLKSDLDASAGVTSMGFLVEY